MSPRVAQRQATLAWRADQLESAVERGGEELAPQDAREARELVDRVRERWQLKGGRTVVALAGATGSGKSTLFNALVGGDDDVVVTGARRPTTAEATAAVWGSEEAGPLLDWLGIGRRHQVPDTGDGELDGLVLIDLPDFDSREIAHRVEADRILQRADVFVWVTDPQKYADARLHEEYLAPLQDHESVMLVVLNQVDRVPDEEAVEAITDDLSRLVAQDGAGAFEVITTSARLRRGLADLRGQVGQVVRANQAAEQRLVGDLRGTSRRLLEGVGPTGRTDGQHRHTELVQALAQAAGVPVVLQAVQRDFQRRSAARAGWPFTRWLAGLRPDPLKRLRLGDDRTTASGVSPSDVRVVLGRSSLPKPSPAARSAVQLATRRVGEDATQQLPPRWAEAVRTAATPEDGRLADALDQAVMRTPLRTRDPIWWSVAGLLQWVFALSAVAGAAWLTVLAVLGWLQIPADAMMWGPLPAPLVLLAGGLVAGLLLAALARMLARIGGRRRRRAVEQRLEQGITTVAKEHVVRPVDAVLERHDDAARQLAAAAS